MNIFQMAYILQKSYVDHIRRDLEFEEDDKVYFKMSSMKGLVRFTKKEKLSPHYVGPYKYCKGLVSFPIN